jgi:hypothetical protein
MPDNILGNINNEITELIKDLNNNPNLQKIQNLALLKDILDKVIVKYKKKNNQWENVKDSTDTKDKEPKLFE